MHVRALCLSIAVPALAAAAEAPPQKAEQRFKNIQSFKGTPAEELDAAMDFMSRALGVGCPHCHVTADNGPWPMDKDDKSAKRVARKMIAMQARINKEFFGGQQVVTCATCHAGRAEPLATPPMTPRREAAAKPAPVAPAGLTPQKLYDKLVTASGGRAAWEKLKSRLSKGTFHGPPEGLGLEVMQAAPDRWNAKLKTKRGAFEQGYDGKIAWRRSPRGEVETLTGHELVEVKRDTPLALPLALPSLLADAKVAPDETEGTRLLHVVTGKMGNVPQKLYFDDKSGLLVKWATELHTLLGDLPEETSYEDYRKVDGVMLPFAVVHNTAGQVQTMKYATITHDVPVDEAAFALPAPAPPATKEPTK